MKIIQWVVADCSTNPGVGTRLGREARPILGGGGHSSVRENRLLPPRNAGDMPRLLGGVCNTLVAAGGRFCAAGEVSCAPSQRAGAPANPSGVWERALLAPDRSPPAHEESAWPLGATGGGFPVLLLPLHAPQGGPVAGLSRSEWPGPDGPLEGGQTLPLGLRPPSGGALGPKKREEDSTQPQKEGDKGKENLDVPEKKLDLPKKS